MARLPPSGVAIATPFEVSPSLRVLTEVDLHGSLKDLCPEATFSDAEIAEFYLEIQLILGRWHAAQGRPDTASLAAALAEIGAKLDSVVSRLSAVEDGLHQMEDIEVVSKLVNTLSEEGSACASRKEAQELIVSFRQDAIKISAACGKSSADFKKHVGKSGRPKLDWYDDFKTLLLKIARLGEIKPTLGKDRITSARTGWLIDAAQKLEIFLAPAMRSPDAESCGKRLERASIVQNWPAGQNPS